MNPYIRDLCTYQQLATPEDKRGLNIARSMKAHRFIMYTLLRAYRELYVLESLSVRNFMEMPVIFSNHVELRRSRFYRYT